MCRVFCRVFCRVLSRMEPDARRKMVVGLGNPGMDGTRHNVGRAVLDRLAPRLEASRTWRRDANVNSDVLVCHLQGATVILLKPRVYMNLNGTAVAKAVQTFGVRPEDVLLVHDDLDKPLGKIALKQGGSARGHNGVRSCIDCLHTDVMRRVRVGVGRPSGHTSVDKHVLGHFSPDQRKVLDLVLVQSVDLLLSLLTPHDPPPGGNKHDPPPGGNKHDPPPGGNKHNPPPGGTKHNQPPGGNKHNQPPGGTKHDPPPGGNKHNPPPGGATQDPPPGGNKHNPPPGGTKHDPPPGGATDSQQQAKQKEKQTKGREDGAGTAAAQT